MKSLKLFSLVAIALVSNFVSNAQDKKEVIAVNGNCGMCKTNIEKAAKSAGATEANWDATSKSLSVTYASSSSNAGKIQQAVAAAGYDTKDVKAPDAAYEKLHGCCKYDRQKSATSAKACEMKDGKCIGEAQCIEKGCCKSKAECAEKGCCGKDSASLSCTKACDHKEHAASTDAKAKESKSCCAAH
jgi:periplasmic mercuric ion binding protein